ncbi:response regulator [Planctomycetota bacterium]
MTPEPQHILVLEDNPTHRKIIALHLTRVGFKVTVAAEASKALALATQSDFDLIIADYYLPDHPGTDFIRLLREDDGYRHVPVILLTGRAADLDGTYLCDELATLLMPKPCSMAKLVDTVSKFLAVAQGAS